MTDLQVDSLDLASPRFKADVERVARIISERHITVGIALSWQLLREIEEETLWDLGLLSRWPAETVAEFALTSELAPHNGLISTESAATLKGLSHFIWTLFERIEEDAVR